MDQQCEQSAPHKLAQSTPLFSSRSSIKTFQLYQTSYRSQLHLLARRTSFFGYKAFRWFRLTENHLLLYSKKTSVEPKTVILLDNISASESRPFLKGFLYCIKLQMPDNRTYWSHCKVQEEKDFLLKTFTKEHKNPPKTSILLNNQTFNPKEYQQYKMDVEFDGDLVSRTNRENQKGSQAPENKGQTLSQPPFRIDSLGEENVVTDTAQEGFISVNQLKAYSDIYIKPRISAIKASPLKDKFSNFKDLTIQCTNTNEVSRSDFSNFHSAEGPLTFTKDSHPSQFPLTPPACYTTKVSYSTKETQSGSFFNKISFPINEKNSGNRLNATAMPRLYVDTSALECDAEEVEEAEEDNFVKRDESANTIRTMEFNGVGKRKAYLTLLSKDESFYRKTSLYTEPDRREVKTTTQEEKTSIVKISTARLRGQVIGPRALMNSIGPALIKKDDEQVIEGATFREEVRKEAMQVKEYLDKEEIESPLCLSLIDPKSDIDLNVNKIDTIDQCVAASHEFIWNYELEKARDCLNLFKDQDLFIELMLTESSMFEIVFSGSIPKIRYVLERLQDLLSKVNNASIPPKQSEKYFSNELNKAEICIYRGAMHFFIGNKFQTIKAFAEGWRHYRRLEPLVEKKSFKESLSARSLHRFRFGLGCFNLVFSLIPTGLLKFMRLVGLMNPNKQKGLDLLEACRKENNIRSNYASIILALYNIEFQGALEKACDIIKESLAAYGKCPIFHWVASIISWKYAQAKDAHFMVKTALWHLKQDSESAIYLIYELGWYSFINMEWQQSLDIFMKVISQTLPLRFFKNQAIDVTALAKSLKLPITIDFSKYQEDLVNAQEERACVLPHLPHIAVKIAVCHFYLGNHELAVKWLLSATVIYRNYSNFKSRQEEDFSKLAIKFLKRSSLKMLVYEVIYLMRYLPKMPDYLLCSILEQIEAYHISLSFGIPQLEAHLASGKKDDPLIVEYFSALMIKIVNYCLLGDTDIACEIYNKHSKYLGIIPEESAYLVVHIEYWIGRALISENKSEEARAMLKALLKRKKCDFSINTRIRRVLAEIK